MIDIPYAVRQQIGSWYIIGTHELPGDNTAFSILAGPFLTVTESERLVPATASLYAILADDEDSVSKFGMACIEEALDTPPRFNELLGLGDSGAPLAPETFQKVLTALYHHQHPVTQDPQWYAAFDLPDPLTRVVHQQFAQTLSRYPSIENLLDALQHDIHTVEPLDIDLLIASGMTIPAPILQALFQQRVLYFLDHNQ
jgi:hypothetical protein